MGNVCCGGGGGERTKNGAFEPLSTTSTLTTVSITDDSNNQNTNDTVNNINSNNSNGRVDNDDVVGDTIGQQQQQQQQRYVADQIRQQQEQQQDEVDKRSAVAAAAAAVAVAEEQERYERIRLEQIRLERIVQNTGRVMVSIRSTRGSTRYYDQGFAAALWQHLQQISAFASTTTTSSSTTMPKSQRHLLPIPEPFNNEHDNDNNTDSTIIYTRLSQPSPYSTLAFDFPVQVPASTSSNGTKQPISSPEQVIDRIAESFVLSIVPKKDRLFVRSGPIVESLM